MKIGLMTAAAAAVLALSTSVFAQGNAPAAKPAASDNKTITTSDYTEQHVDGNQVVTFPGDALPGDANSSYGFAVRRPPGVLRAGLIRPRVNFVPELLKSVENL